MKALLKSATAIAALTYLVVGSANAAEWELWPDPTTPPLDAEVTWLTFLPGITPGATFASETDTSIFFIDVHQTRERDGELYKAVQFYRDTVVEDTVVVGQWVHGGPDNATYPPGTVDCLAFERAWRLISLEVDGTVIPIDMETWLHLVEVDLSEYGLGVWPCAWYNVAVRYNTTGPHTYRAVFRQVEEYFYIEPYAEQGMVDPSPELGGRRVLVGEQVGEHNGSPVDGDIVYTCNLRVVAEPTAVEATTWGQVKAALHQ